MLAPCWGQVGAILGHLGASAWTGRAGGDTRSVLSFSTLPVLIFDENLSEALREAPSFSKKLVNRVAVCFVAR